MFFYERERTRKSETSKSQNFKGRFKISPHVENWDIDALLSIQINPSRDRIKETEVKVIVQIISILV